MKFKPSKIILFVLLTIGIILFFFPVFWTITTSFKTPEEIWLIPPAIFPDSFFHLDNYREVFQREEFGRYLFNSFTLCLSAVGISLVGGIHGGIRVFKVQISSQRGVLLHGHRRVDGSFPVSYTHLRAHET